MELKLTTQLAMIFLKIFLKFQFFSSAGFSFIKGNMRKKKN